MVDTQRFLQKPSWDPFERGKSWTPSLADTLMSYGNGSTGWVSCKSFQGQSSGKWYAEIVATSGTAARVFGFCDSSCRGESFLGNMSKSIGFLSGGASKFTSGIGVSSSWGTSFTITAGDVLNMAMDIDNGKVWIGKNGTWLGSGDPATGANAAGLIPAGTWHFAMSCQNNGTGTYTLNTTSVTGSIPSGFSVLPSMARGKFYIVMEGDSITAGSVGPTTPYGVVAITSSALNQRYRNFSAGGVQISYMETNATTYYDWYALNRSDKKSVVSILGGHNDISGSRTAAQVITSLQNYGANRKAAGHHVVMCTILPDSVYGGFNTTRATVNTAMRTWGGTYWDSLVDFDTDLMGLDATASNATYYSDGIHPTQVGMNRLAAVYQPVIEAIT